MQLPENIRLSEKEVIFVDALVRGFRREEICEKAGYGEMSYWSVLQRPRVAAAIAFAIDRRISVEAAPLAIKCLVDILGDDKASQAVRVTAAKTILDRAGYVPPKAADAPNLDKDLNEMGTDDLRSFVTQATQVLSSRAVDITPDGAPDETQDIVFE